MSQPFDLSQFPNLPPEVVKAFSAVQFELSVERVQRASMSRQWWLRRKPSSPN
jgi:hypothetical protein